MSVCLNREWTSKDIQVVQFYDGPFFHLSGLCFKKCIMSEHLCIEISWGK